MATSGDHAERARRAQERRERILAEVEDHLRDAVESLIAAGSTAGEAELEAVARFGSPQEAAGAPAQIRLAVLSRPRARGRPAGSPTRY